MMKISETNFADAETAFKKFLAENGLAKPIVWIFKEDTYWRSSRSHYQPDFWLKVPVPTENEQLAAKLYEIGRRKGLGIALTALAEVDGAVCCGMVIPTDEEDAQYMLASPEYLKFSAVEEPRPKVTPIRSGLRWALFKLLPSRYRPGNFFVYLASKRDVREGRDR